MLDFYDVADVGAKDEVPQSRFEAGFDITPSEAVEELAVCQNLLVLAKTQRTMYPLHSPVGHSRATDVAKAELRLANAYRNVGSLDQVKVHILAGLNDLRLPEVRAHPLNGECTNDDHRDTLVATLKLLGEICMEEKPVKHQKALAAFTSAIPGLPMFDIALLGGSHVEAAASCRQELEVAGTLSDDVSEVLMTDLPVAAAVGSCYEHVAAELLHRIEGLQRNRSKLFHRIFKQLRCICALEQKLRVTPPHPQLLRQRLAPVTRTSDTVEHHCRQVLNVLASASLHDKPVPYWSAVSGGHAATPASVTHAVAQWRSHVRRSTVMHSKVVERPQLPDVGTCHWMLTTPMQKLEQLGTQLALARAAKQSTLVLVGTESVAVYLAQLLENVQEQGYMVLGTVVAITLEMTFQEKATMLEKRTGVIIATESQLAGLHMQNVKRFIQYDITPHSSTLLAKASAHASVILFIMRHEVLAVNLLQDAGVSLNEQATDLLPLQYNQETDRTLSIEALMRRKDFAEVPLREAGVQAFTHYVCWYCSMHSPLVTASSALLPHSLRAVFLVPTANDAVSSMAHSFHTRMRSASANMMDITPSTMCKHSAAMANHDEEVSPAVLENAVSVMEALEVWQQSQAPRAELESAIKVSLGSLATLDAKLRALPPQAHAVADQAVTLLYCVTTELAKERTDRAPGADHLERKLWHSICEVHFIAGCLLLNDVNKTAGEQLRGCAQQLDQILMTQDYHQGRAVVSRNLEAKTLDLYGKCAMGLGELHKAESLFLRLKDLSKASNKSKRRIDQAHAEVLLGDVYALCERHQEAGESYQAAMATFRAHLPPQNKHIYCLQERMLALLHKRQAGIRLS
eukprot:jgi/Ulvmu1/4332/UM002_0055.1